MIYYFCNLIHENLISIMGTFFWMSKFSTCLHVITTIDDTFFQVPKSWILSLSLSLLIDGPIMSSMPQAAGLQNCCFCCLCCMLVNNPNTAVLYTLLMCAWITYKLFSAPIQQQKSYKGRESSWWLIDRQTDTSQCKKGVDNVGTKKQTNHQEFYLRVVCGDENCATRIRVVIIRTHQHLPEHNTGWCSMECCWVFRTKKVLRCCTMMLLLLWRSLVPTRVQVHMVSEMPHFLFDDVTMIATLVVQGLFCHWAFSNVELLLLLLWCEKLEIVAAAFCCCCSMNIVG